MVLYFLFDEMLFIIFFLFKCIFYFQKVLSFVSFTFKNCKTNSKGYQKSKKKEEIRSNKGIQLKIGKLELQGFHKQTKKEEKVK